jgi:hypothetical protein
MNTSSMQSYGATLDGLKQLAFLPQIESRRSRRLLVRAGFCAGVASFLEAVGGHWQIALSITQNAFLPMKSRVSGNVASTNFAL